jgi:hypothetical protein
MSPAHILGQNSNLIEESHTEEPPKVDHSTHKSAFMVLIDEDGNYTLETDINKPVIPKRNPSSQEIKAALSVLLFNIQTQETAMLSANAVVSLQMQMAQRMSEAQQTAQVQQLLTKGR